MATLSTDPGFLTPASGAPSINAIEKALEVHYRGVLHESKVNYSAAWQDARVSIRFLNHLSPLLLSVIQRSGANANQEDRKTALAYLTTSTAVLSKVMAERIAPNQQLKQYDQVELNSVLTHLVGRLWERSSNADPQKSVDELLATVTSLYSDPAFIQRHNRVAQMMMQCSGYLKVDSEETMTTRLRLSMHQATIRFYEATVDERISNGKEVFFSYGIKRVEVVAAMQAVFDEAIKLVFTQAQFPASLTNDQRTSIMQTWLRAAADIFRSEYVARTLKVMSWFREDPDQFRARFEKAKTMLPDVLESAASSTMQIMQDLIAVANYQPLEVQDPLTPPTPAQ